MIQQIVLHIINGFKLIDNNINKFIEKIKNNNSYVIILTARDENLKNLTFDTIKKLNIILMKIKVILLKICYRIKMILKM